jgi:1,4-alpha-glucan branching enzyme
MHLYKKYGALKKNNGYLFRTHAPESDQVSLITNNKKTLMNKVGTDWELFVKNIKPNTPYSFLIEKNNQRFEKSDPFSRKVITLAPKHLQSFTTDSTYVWKNKKPKQKDTIKICEVFMENLEGKDYLKKVENLILYLKDKDFTHVQIMPIYHFSELITLGYLSNSYFSPFTRYGDVDDFKFFIDKLHEKNIGVILDFVLFEFKEEDLGLNNYDGGYLFNKNKNERHPYFGGYLFDLSKKFVRDFLSSSVNYFINEFNVDGFRFDAINEIIYKNINNNIFDEEQLFALREIINNLDDCLIITENISSINYDNIKINKIKFIENSNYMYQVDYLFKVDEKERFSIKDFTEIEQHNIRFQMNKNLIASITHDMFLDGITLKKDTQSLISNGNKLEKQKIKLAMIYSAPGNKLVFKDYDTGFENTDLVNFFETFMYVYDKNITKDYLSFQINKFETVIVYSYFYSNKVIRLLFNIGSSEGSFGGIEKILFKDSSIKVNGTTAEIKPYSYLIFENKENKI